MTTNHISPRHEPESIAKRLIIFFFFIFGLSNAQITNRRIGINYGRRGNNLPSPYQSIEHIKSMQAGYIKIYDANPETLKLLANTRLRVSIMVPNDQIPLIGSNETVARQWIRDNVLPYLPQTRIRYIMVGNEILSTNNQTHRANLVPAMHHIQRILKTYRIHSIKVSTPLAMDLLQVSFPPSNGVFRVDTLSTLVPILDFLNTSGSHFFLDVYPYFPWSADPTSINLDFALLNPGHLTYRDPGSGFVYNNLLDQMLDSVYFAMTKLGYPNIAIAISETGWPNGGDVDQHGANVHNAATYIRNLVRKINANPPLGTPARPRTVIPTFLFSLYDENGKPGPGTERHWGLLRPDGTPVYEFDLMGVRNDYGPLPEPVNNSPYEGDLWCVVGAGANVSALIPEVAYACEQLNGTCDALAPGKGCYEPVSVVWHASYVFSAYWTKFRSSGATCHFNGLASQTTTNPSHGLCKFSSVTLP